MARGLSSREEVLRSMEAEVRKLVVKLLPGAEPTAVTAREGTDHDGDPSLFIQVVLKARSDPKLARQRNSVADQFQTWLITHYDDERFPYFDFVAAKDLKEREQAGD